MTYGQIADQYADFVISRYGQATVVFDGYNDGSNVKANEQRRRQKTSPLVHCDSNTVFSNGKAEAVLSHVSYKKQIISQISTRLSDKGCNIVQCPADADVDIVKTAVKSSLVYDTTLIGEDTDLLFLMLCYAEEGSKKTFL